MKYSVFRPASESLIEPAIVDLAVVVEQVVDHTPVLVQELLSAVELVLRALDRQFHVRVTAVEHQADRAR